MKTIHSFLICFSFYFSGFISAHAQNWSTYIAVKHPDGFTDTVYIGLNDNAASGWQPELDIRADTNSSGKRIRITAHDPVVASQQGWWCGNLERDIRPFNWYQEFVLLVYSDTFPHYNEPEFPPVTFYFDSAGFTYKDNGRFLGRVTLKSDGAFLFGSIHLDSLGLYSAFWNSGMRTYRDSVWVNLYTPSVCPPYQISLRVKIYFYEYLGAEESFQLIDGPFKVFPNPMVNELHLQKNDAEQYHITLSNATGQSLMNTTWSEHSLVLPTAQLSPGLYFLTLRNSLTGKIYSIRLNKNSG
ncbi:MAG: T9SS type A sorting domain-containing protein [Bacteroidia bacterium]